MVRPITEPCGTPAAYKRHIRNSQVPCRECCAAEASRKRAHQAAVKQLIANHRDEFDGLLAQNRQAVSA